VFIISVFIFCVFVWFVKKVPVKMIERSLFSTVHVFAENCRRKYVCSKIFLFLYICKELRERLGIDDIILILQQNSLGMCCEKKTLIG